MSGHWINILILIVYSTLNKSVKNWIIIKYILKMSIFSESWFDLFLKLITSIWSSVLSIWSIYQLYVGTLYYTQFLVWIYNIIFSISIVLNEFSPRIREDYLFDIFPFLGYSYGKGVFWLIISSFMFDGTFNEIGFISGILFIMWGISWIVFEYTMSKYSDTQLEFKYPTNGFVAIKEVRHSQYILQNMLES